MSIRYIKQFKFRIPILKTIASFQNNIVANRTLLFWAFKTLIRTTKIGIKKYYEKCASLWTMCYKTKQLNEQIETKSFMVSARSIRSVYVLEN